jgi:hypothetical protein
VAQFGVASSFNEQVYMPALFTHVSALYNQELTVMHAGSIAAEKMLQQTGMHLFIYSYEMERGI